MNIRTLSLAAIIGCGYLTIAVPCFADDGKTAPGCIDWKKLSLSAQQSQQVVILEQEWTTRYTLVQPEISNSQKKLGKLLADPKSDPLEIMATQQTVTRLKEQLRNDATTNYLRKRALLNENQQHQLESMLQQMVADRQHKGDSHSASSDDQNGGIMNIIHQVKWAIEPH